MRKDPGKPKFAATNMGNVPYRDAREAVEAVFKYFPEAPRLPVTSRTMKWLLEGIPCLVFDRKRRQVLMDPSPEREKEILEFYDRYEKEDLDYFATTPQTAPFLYEMLRRLERDRPPQLKWVMFQTAGPLLLGTMIKQMNGKPVLYHDLLKDILIKGLNMKARWLEKKLAGQVPGVEIVADLPETTLVNFTSSAGTGTREEIIRAINEGFERLNGITWVHCCANIDWSLLTDTKAHVINFDAYQHSEKVILYADHFGSFLERGGMIGWGITPVREEVLTAENVDSLVKRLEKGIKAFVSKGIDEELLVSSSWVLPCCDTVLLSPQRSELVYHITREISVRMRSEYGFHT